MAPESFSVSEPVILFIRLLIAHLAGDFVFQKKSWIVSRAALKWRSGYLYANAAIVGLLSWVLSGYPSQWLIPLLIFLAHAVIDTLKSYAPDKPVVFAMDQAGHLVATVVFTWLYVQWESTPLTAPLIYNNLYLWTYTASYLTVMWPMGIIISMMTRKWQADSEQIAGLPDAGKYIGMLERILILTFIFAGEFSAIGFLVAAKSVLRFGDIRESGNRKNTEYILIGTMLSFTAAILTGILAKWLLKLPVL